MPWMNVKKAAEIFDVSEGTIHRWIGKGLLVSYLTGGRRYVHLKYQQFKGAKNQTLSQKLIQGLLEDLEELQVMVAKFLESFRYFQRFLPEMVWGEDIQNKEQWESLQTNLTVICQTIFQVIDTRTLDPITLRVVYLVWKIWMECRRKDVIREFGAHVKTHSDEMARMRFTRIIGNLQELIRLSAK